MTAVHPGSISRNRLALARTIQLGPGSARVSRALVGVPPTNLQANHSHFSICRPDHETNQQDADGCKGDGRAPQFQPHGSGLEKLNVPSFELRPFFQKSFIAPLIVLLFFGFSASRSASIEGVEHVILIGVDGLSPNGLRHAQTPHLNQLIATGAHTFHARAVMPTSSSPNWASMIMGAGPEQHGVTSNDWQTNKFEIAPIAKGSGGIFPTIFGILREQRPQFVIACFHDWNGFGRLLERSAPNVIEHVKDAIETTSRTIKYLGTEKPNFLFVHFDCVDHAGHGFGWDSPQYYKAVELVDSLVGALLDAITKSGTREKTIFLVTADHGGKGKSHGGATMDEIEIPWIINGPGVERGKEIKTPVNTYDTAATVAFIFGIDPPTCWIGKPVRDAFGKAGFGSSN